VALHTRSLKYGLLAEGEFLAVTPALIKRSPKHFHTLPCGVCAILGTNGYIHLGEPGSDSEHNDHEDQATTGEVNSVSPEFRNRLCRVRNSILVLNTMFISIHALTIMDVYNASERLSLSESAMLDWGVASQLSETARSRRDLHI